MSDPRRVTSSTAEHLTGRPADQPPPYVFISYSHDSKEHRSRVLSLANELRRGRINCHLDRYEPFPEKGWPLWMIDQIERADFVLVVCTETYHKRVLGREAAGAGLGARWEGAIITHEIYRAGGTNKKYVPVIFRPEDNRYIPFFLPTTYYNVSVSSGYEQLYRLLSGQPEVIMSELGERVALNPVSAPSLFESSPPQRVESSVKDRSVERPAQRTALLGLAIDVSGSMATSMPRRLRKDSTRLEAIRRSLDQIAREAFDIDLRTEENSSTIELFAYAFGLRLGAVCDLLSLVKASAGVLSPAEIEQVKRQIQEETDQRFGGYREVGNFLQQYLDRPSIQAAESLARNMAESAVRTRLLARVRPRIEARLAEIGDTTIALTELHEIWEKSEESLESAEEIIFGDTPMQQAFKMIAERFEREWRGHASGVPSLLFVLSDGDSTDGDPIPFAEDLKRAGVTVVACFVTDHDVVAPRQLFSHPHSTWGRCAETMFSLASTAAADNPFVRSLKQQGWNVPDRARLFVQVNHSDVLDEFVRGILGYVDAPGSLTIPRGK